MLDRLLKKQGFTSKEVSIFTLLMELGEQPASVTAKKLNISRSATYSCLNRLMELGLISQITRSGTTYYQANDPGAYLDELSRQRQSEINQIGTLKLSLQVERKKKSLLLPKSNAHYYSGESGLQTLIKLICSNPSPLLRVFLCRNPFARISLKRFFEEAEKAGTDATYEVCKVLSTEKGINMTKALVKQVPAAFNLGIDLIISGDKLALISFPENFGLLIESRLITNAQSKVFDLVWRIIR